MSEDPEVTLLTATLTVMEPNGLYNLAVKADGTLSAGHPPSSDVGECTAAIEGGVVLGFSQTDGVQVCPAESTRNKGFTALITKYFNGGDFRWRSGNVKMKPVHT